MSFPIKNLLMLSGLLLVAACAPAQMNGQPPAVAGKEVARAMPEYPPLYCQIGLGLAQFGRDWKDFDDSEFTLYRGEHSNVRLVSPFPSKEMALRVFFERSGQKMTFCPLVEGPPRQRVACASVYALEDDFRDGIRRTLDIPAAVRSGVVTCAYSRGSLVPLHSYESSSITTGD